MTIYVIGHPGSGLTATCASASNHDSIVVTPTTSASSSQFNNNEYYITLLPNAIDLGISAYLECKKVFEEMKAGWLKPNKQLRPFNQNSKINYNLPRSRLREKKQIFLKAA